VLHATESVGRRDLACPVGLSAANVRSRCAAVMVAQHGLISRAQALEVGLSHRQIELRLSSGAWQRRKPRVYAAAEFPSTWRQHVMAACLWGGEGAAASHRTAAHLFGLSGSLQGRIEICTPRRLTAIGVVVHQRKLHPQQTVRIDKIPVTNLPTTLLDIASVFDTPRLETAIDDALVRGLTTKDRLQATLHCDLRGVAGADSLRRVLNGYTHAPLESPLERKFLRLLRSAGLPEPQVQYPIYDGDRFLARVDFAYPELRLAIEVDGFRWHGGRSGWVHDLSRRNDLMNRRWRLLHIANEHMEGSGGVAVKLVREARAAAEQTFEH
jgi:very-short-patch-repair endonuclease